MSIESTDTARRIRELVSRWAGVDADVITMESKLRDLGVDSLQFASLLALIEAELRIECDDTVTSRFLAARRVGELVAAVSSSREPPSEVATES